MSITYSAFFGQFELRINNLLYDRYFAREHAVSAWQEYKRNLRYGRAGMNRVAEVNRELKARGIPDKLRRGRGYYYFYGPNADSWYSASVAVYRAESLTVDRWLAEYEILKKDWRNE